MTASMGRLLAVWAVAAAAWGQPVGTPGRDSESHGWIAARSLAGGGATLLHLPPRESGVGVAGVDAGVVRTLRVLDKLPAQAVADSRRVFLLYAGSSGRLDVFSIRVRPAGLSGHWLAEPTEGAQAEPTLSMGGASFVDGVAVGGELLVMLADERLRLWRLAAAGWEEMVMPPVAAQPGSGWTAFVSGEAEPTLIEFGGGRAVRWQGGGEGMEDWSPLLLTETASIDHRSVLCVFSCGGDVCLALRTDVGYEVLSLGPGIEGRIAGSALAGRPYAAVPLSGGMRVAAMSLIHHEAAQGRAQPIDEWEIVETSLATGRELYRGRPRVGTLALGEEIRWLSLGMMGLAAGVLFYLLRPAPSPAEPVLPRDCALAGPGRRLIAGVADGAIVAGVVCVALDVPVSRVLLVLPLLETPGGVLALTAIVGLGAVSSALCEWATGRSPGKLLTGCRVVSVVPGRARVGLARSVARNAFRWAFAPWALLGMGPPNMRHRGDVVAGAAVVVRIRGGRAGEGRDGHAG